MAFMQEIVKTAHDKNMYEIFCGAASCREYIKEAAPLIKLSTDALYTGLVAEPASLKHHYRLVQREKTVDVNDADAVFGALDRSKEAAYFADALFRNETPGFIYHVYLCDPSESGRAHRPNAEAGKSQVVRRTVFADDRRRRILLRRRIE